MTDIPQMPERPTRPEESARMKQSPWVTILFAFGAGLVLLIGMVALFASVAPMFGAVLAAAVLLIPFILIHYLLWGRYLGDMIRQEVAREEALEEQEKKDKLSLNR